MTGKTEVINGFYYLTIYYKDSLNRHKRTRIKTDLPERGNKKAAEKLLKEKMEKFLEFSLSLDEYEIYLQAALDLGKLVLEEDRYSLKEIYDIIILDGPPTQLVTDSLILTRIVNSTILVIASNETKKNNLHKIIDNIKNVGGNISGVVINKVAISKKEYKQNYYYKIEDEKKH